ncbi:hypothetical protein [Lacinutrix undariae]
MTLNTSNKPNKRFWIITGIAIIWNGMGVMQYLAKAYNTDNFKAQYTKEQLSIIANEPTWVTFAFALAVFGGLFGSIALVFRKKIAHVLFLISTLGICAQMIYNLFIIKSVDIYGPAAVLMTAMILIIALFLLIYSRRVTSKGWLS